MAKKVLWLQTNHKPTLIEREDDLDLGELQRLVGGYVIPWPLRVHYQGKQVQMLVDEDGIPKGLPLNEEATRIVREEAQLRGWTGAYLDTCKVLGNAVLCLDGDLD